MRHVLRQKDFVLLWNLLTAHYQSCHSLSLSLAMSIHWFAQSCCEVTNAPQQCWDYFFYTGSGWLKFAYVVNSISTRDETRDLQNALPMTLTLLFFYTSGTLHARHIHTSFELWGRAILLVTSCFFWCCYERNSIHTASLSHFISLVRLTTCFLSSCGWLLDSRKHWLFHLYIQHATHCLFERRNPVDSSKAAVCGFCFSISLHPHSKTTFSVLRKGSWYLLPFSVVS